MHSLSPEMNRALMAEVCERIIWSGGGEEASWGGVIVKVKERRGALAATRLSGDPARRARNQCHCKKIKKARSYIVRM
jgi:hypothetical protein